jgi:hypothetical protein
MKMSDIHRGGCGVGRFNVIRTHSPELHKETQSESCRITVKGRIYRTKPHDMVPTHTALLRRPTMHLVTAISRILRSYDRASYQITFQWNQQTHSFPNLLLYKTLQVSGSSSTHHQELATVLSALAYVIQLACRIRTELPETCRVLYKNKFGNKCVCCFHWKVISRKSSEVSLASNLWLRL